MTIVQALIIGLGQSLAVVPECQGRSSHTDNDDNGF